MDFTNFTPDKIICVVEEFLGTKLTGYTAPFSSYINRVYELRTIDGEKIVVKFYRPDRWSRQALLDEHRFILDCQNDEVPVVPPMLLKNGETIGAFDSIYFAVFGKKAGRQLEINDERDWIRLGSLVGRLHVTGSSKPALSRITIHPQKSTIADCNYLYEKVIPEKYRDKYKNLCHKLISIATPLFERAELIRIHGDLHAGNILDRMDEGLLLIDFDDMAMGPPVQDFWLLLPERADKSRAEIGLFLEGYERFRRFDRRTLSCIEPLRAMRMIYFLAWCSRQRNDYQFKKNFPEWGNDVFWQREINDLQEQIGYCLESEPEEMDY